MPASVWNGSSWAPVKAMPVWNGSSWVPGKKAKVWNGSSWVLAWVPPVEVASLSFSKTGVKVNEAYNVTLNVPGGFPEGAEVTLRFAGYSYGPLPTVEGSTTHTLAGASHASPGSYAWYADVFTKGGNTTFGPFTQTATVLKTLYTTVDNANPTEGQVVRLTAGCSTGCDQPYSSAGWLHRWPGGGWNWSGGGNPLDWQSHRGGGEYIDWMWRETFADGSSIDSTPVRVNVGVAAPTHYHEVVPSGSGRQQIQDAMDRAYNHFLTYQTGTAVNFDSEATMACVELVAGGSYALDGPLYVRRGVRLIGAGSGASRPIINAPTADSIIFRTGNNGGGGYQSPFFDWLVENIRLNCSGWTGGFSISHCRRFRIKGCDFSGLGGKKHYIEINSSGGARQDGTFNVEVLNCYFTMPNGSSNPNKPRRTEDECVQFDYSWTASASDVANDGTVTNNVLVDGCTFYRVPRGVGSHHYEEGVNGEHYPNGIHANLVIQNCTFQEVNPTTYGDGANGSGSEGAVRAYTWSNVHILSNTFIDCLQPINLYIQAGATTRNGNPRYYRIAGNVIRNKTSTRPGINSSSAHATMRHEQVLVEYNNVDGSWGGTDYFVGMGDTGAETLPASSATVVIRNNLFAPSGMTAAEEKAYNKYKAKGADNGGDVLIYANTVSDGAEDNS